MTRRSVTLTALEGLPDIAAGDDLAALIHAALHAAGEGLQPGDIVAVAQKIVSKAEGRMVRLADVSPSPKAHALAAETGKDAALCEVLIGETREAIRERAGLVIVEDVRGLVLANAGIDASNVVADGGHVLLLPEDPDESAARLREGLSDHTGVAPGVIVTDSIGRAWRMGTIGTAIGVAGIPALLDLRGQPDMHGRRLETTEVGLADEIAAAASLLMGQADERCPVVLIRGLDLTGKGNARDLQRPPAMDLFR